MLGDIVRATENLNVSLDDVAHIPQHQRCTLLPIVAFVHIESKIACPILHGFRHRARADLIFHFIAANRCELDRIEHRDAIDMPAYLRLPVDCLHNASRRRGCHHVITDTLDLHLRASKASPLAPTVQLDAECHLRLLDTPKRLIQPGRRRVQPLVAAVDRTVEQKPNTRLMLRNKPAIVQLAHGLFPDRDKVRL